MKELEYEQINKKVLNNPVDFIYTESVVKEWLTKNDPYFEVLLDGMNLYFLEVDFDEEVAPKHLFYQLYLSFESIAESFSNEHYFKKELETYPKIKTNEVELNKWLRVHQEDKEGKLSSFKSSFEDRNSRLGFKFEVRLPVLMKLNPEDLQYSIQFVNLIERSKRLRIKGRVKEIFEMEVSRGYNNYYTQKIRIESKNQSSTYIRFHHDKMNLLANINLGNEIIVFTDKLKEMCNCHKEKCEHAYIAWDLLKV